jgi:hypothetical protein
LPQATTGIKCRAAEDTPEGMSAAVRADIIFGGAENNKFVSQVGVIGSRFHIAFQQLHGTFKTKDRVFNLEWITNKKVDRI